MKLRLIFTEAVQDGPDHWTNKWWTVDIPVPESKVDEIKNHCASVAGVEIIKESGAK